MDRFAVTVGHSLTLAELMAALSHALDITEGQPRGHCVRCCWIGMHIGRMIGLDEDALWELYYTLLLKDLGCSSNAARICELYLTDDLAFKRDFKHIGTSSTQVISFVLSHTGLHSGLSERFKTLFHLFRNGEDIGRELFETRCQRGAEIARKLRFSEGVAKGILHLDEHWNGGGKPSKLSGRAISPFARIALIAQVADVFFINDGKDAAIEEVRRRSGTWFDPDMVAAFESAAASKAFWLTLSSPAIEHEVFSLEPARHTVALDDDYLDDIAAGFGHVVDSKSPYTAGHSERVALYTDMLARTLGLPHTRRRWLKRAALLHDLGKLGVSNSILDKPGKLNEDEWAAVQKHAAYTTQILSRIGAFSELADVAGAHHERLDGKGYPNGWSAERIALETRIITTADIFDAITAERPYRGAIPVQRALQMMEESVDTAIDRNCLEALKLALVELEIPLH